MNNKLHYSPEALTDLDNIWNFISAKQENANIAIKVIDRISNHIRHLIEYPETGLYENSISRFQYPGI